MKPDLSTLTVAELENLKVEADRQLVDRKQTEVQSAYQQAEAIARTVGLSLAELVEQGVPRRGRRKSSATGMKVEPRYRNPQNPVETWTGRGKKPRWLAAKLDSGASIDQFLIK